MTPHRWARPGAAPPAPGDGWQLEEVVPPARLFGTNGIRAAADGTVWIAQVQGNRLSAWDPATTSVRTVAGGSGGLPGPDDLAFDAQGTAYVTQPHAHRVSAVGGDGRITVLVDDAPEANGITVTPDGRVFVGECRPDGRLLEISRRPGRAGRVVRGGIGMANALEMGPDGLLYLPEIMSDRVLAVDPGSGATTVALDRVRVPSAVKFDPHGRLVVAESATGRLLRVDADGAEGAGPAVLATTEPGIDNFTFDAAGAVYISNFVHGSLWRADAGGGPAEEVLPGALLAPSSICVDTDGSLLVADWLSVVAVHDGADLHRVAQVPLEFRFTVVGAARAGASLVVHTSDGDLWHRIGGGDFAPIEGACGTDPGPGFGPPDALGSVAGTIGAGAASAPGAGLALAAWPGGRVHRIIASGIGPEVASVTLAAVTAVAGQGSAVAACDRRAGCVVLVDEDGRRWQWDGFDAPAAVAVSAGAVFVAEADTGDIWRLLPDSGGRRRIGRRFAFGGPIPGEAVRAGGPALCADGADGILVASDGDGTIRRLRPA